MIVWLGASGVVTSASKQGGVGAVNAPSPKGDDMAKKSGGKATLNGPMYTEPSNSLGAVKVEGPKHGMSPADPLNLGPAIRKGPGNSALPKRTWNKE